jgi:hypothetical protein
MEIHTAEPIVPESSWSEVDIPIAKSKKFVSPGIGLIQAGGETLQFEMHELINSIWNKEDLLEL